MHRLTVMYDVWDAATKEAPGEYGGSAVLLKAEDQLFSAFSGDRLKYPLGVGGWSGDLRFSCNGRLWSGHWEVERS